jgi:hypothetical protein
MLKNEFDLFFRTNLSSMIHLDAFTQYAERTPIIYSGGFCWENGLRDDLIRHNKIGPDKSITALEELDSYPGNTFVSGCGYFLNQDEVRSIVASKTNIRYDIIDDVAVGLMLSQHRRLDQFVLTILDSDSREAIIEKLDRHFTHVRLERLSVYQAEIIFHLIRRQYPSYLPSPSGFPG